MSVKSSSSSDIKNSIIQICRMLKYGNICDKISPDHFRQAKLDKPEAVEPMRCLLVFLYKFLEYSDEKPMIDTQGIKDKIIASGYPRMNCDVETSSKEMLLCFGWLLHTTQLFSSLKDICLEDVNPTQIMYNQKNFENEQTFKNLEFSSLSLEDRLKYLFWLMNRIEVNSNNLKSFQAYNSTMEVKAMKKTTVLEKKTNRNNYYTCDELLLLKHSKLLNECEKELERKIQFLSAFLKWEILKPIFWDWMNNLLTESPKVKVCDVTIKSQDSKLVQYHSEQLADKMKELKKCLNESEKKLLKDIEKNPQILSGVRIEQKHEINSKMEEIFKNVGALHIRPRIIPDTENNLSQSIVPISLETNRIQNLNSSIQAQLNETQQLLAKKIDSLAQSSGDAQTLLVVPYTF